MEKLINFLKEKITTKKATELIKKGSTSRKIT